MIFIRQSLVWAALGALLLPTHWCCFARAAVKPCCSRIADIEPSPTPAKSCCAKHDTPVCEHVGAGLVEAPASKPALCCCVAPRVATPTVVQAAPIDVGLVEQIECSCVAYVEPSFRFADIDPFGGVDAEARLCRRRC